MDGLTFSRKVRELERTGDLPGRLPMVGLAANFMPDHVAQLMEAGMVRLCVLSRLNI
jgi:CheY-like chemotaxis protein